MVSASVAYGVTGAVAVAGRPQRERLIPGCFGEYLRAGKPVVALSQHDWSAPLGSTALGTLTLEDGPAGLTARLTSLPNTGYARDLAALHEAGLVRGLSPRIRPRPGGVRIAGDGVREIVHADLPEVSFVTLPTWPGPADGLPRASWLTEVDGLDDEPADPALARDERLRLVLAALAAS